MSHGTLLQHAVTWGWVVAVLLIARRKKFFGALGCTNRETCANQGTTS
jgi:hypothetical protein